jgi:PRTRC genetic system protein E
MSMFAELYALASSATLAMVISADDKTGKLTINVVPKPKKDMDEPALTKALSLTATPAEFDADFVTALKDYREARQSLIEQAEATQEVLHAAKAASAKKAGEAMTKATKPAPAVAVTKVPMASTAGTPGALDEGEDGAIGEAPQQPSTAAGGDAFDLFG